MKDTYSKSEIRRFRQLTPIQQLIVDILKIPNTQTDKGCYRFQCPTCKSENAVVLKDRNFAYCPNCDTNYNPIDIVMGYKNLKFKQASDFLYSLKLV